MASSSFQDLTLFSGGGGGGGSSSNSRPVDIDQSSSPPVGVGTLLNGGGDKTPRLPRWTRQEILVLIQGKRVAENRVRRGRTAGLAAYGTAGGQLEPKWASVSSYCRRHGVNRGPIQCRKRWSNLAGDFKKIKEWETGVAAAKEGGGEEESYWVMRNDLRRERKLPGFFDKEVYDILDGVAPVPAVVAAAAETGSGDGLLALSLTRGGGGGSGPVVEVDDEDVKKEVEETVFDSGRTAAAEDGLFDDFEQEEKDATVAVITEAGPPGIPAPIPISEKQYLPFTAEVTDQGTSPEATTAVNPPEIGSTSNHDKKKRKRLSTETTEPRELEEEGNETTNNDDDDNNNNNNNGNNFHKDQLIEVLERNGRILGAHLENQNTNLKLDREERKDYANSLVSVLNKLADALGKIADKL